MPIEYEIERAINSARDRLHCFPECATCKHVSESHGMNCMECCPVRREMERAAKTR